MTRKRKNSWKTFCKVLFIVLVIAVIIISVGWIIRSNSNPELNTPPEKKKIPNDADLLKKQRDKIHSRQSELAEKIAKLESDKAEILKREKRFYFWARMVIASFLVAVNILYIHIRLKWSFAMDRILAINEAMLLTYSFAAFVTYGTPSRFIKEIRIKISTFLKREHIHVISELDLLKQQFDLNSAELKDVESKIEALRRKRQTQTENGTQAQ